MGEGQRELHGRAHPLKDVVCSKHAKQKDDLSIWEPNRNIPKENRVIKFSPCNVAMDLTSVMFPNNHLGSVEKYILAV